MRVRSHGMRRRGTIWGVTEAQVARKVPPPYLTRLPQRNGIPSVTTTCPFMSLDMVDGHSGHMVSCIRCDYVFQWESVMVVNCFKVWDNDARWARCTASCSDVNSIHRLYDIDIQIIITEYNIKYDNNFNKNRKLNTCQFYIIRKLK